MAIQLSSEMVVEATNTTVVKSTISLVPMATVVQIMEINASTVKECLKIMKSNQKGQRLTEMAIQLSSEMIVEATNTTVVKSTEIMVPMATVVQIMENSACTVKECSKMMKLRMIKIVQCNESYEAK
jgi:thymidine phosphorylase